MSITEDIAADKLRRVIGGAFDGAIMVYRSQGPAEDGFCCSLPGCKWTIYFGAGRLEPLTDGESAEFVARMNAVLEIANGRAEGQASIPAASLPGSLPGLDADALVTSAALAAQEGSGVVLETFPDGSSVVQFGTATYPER